MNDANYILVGIDGVSHGLLLDDQSRVDFVSFGVPGAFFALRRTRTVSEAFLCAGSDFHLVSQ